MTTIIELLAALGDTPDAVAETLRRGGFTGRRCRAAACPVARYLSDRMGCSADVGPGFAYDGRRGTLLPAPVRTFIAEFDWGRYPDLIEPAASAASHGPPPGPSGAADAAGPVDLNPLLGEVPPQTIAVAADDDPPGSTPHATTGRDVTRPAS